MGGRFLKVTLDNKLASVEGGVQILQKLQRLQSNGNRNCTCAQGVLTHWVAHERTSVRGHEFCITLIKNNFLYFMVNFRDFSLHFRNSDFTLSFPISSFSCFISTKFVHKPGTLTNNIGKQLDVMVDWKMSKRIHNSDFITRQDYVQQRNLLLNGNAYCTSVQEGLSIYTPRNLVAECCCQLLNVAVSYRSHRLVGLLFGRVGPFISQLAPCLVRFRPVLAFAPVVTFCSKCLF